MTRLEELVKALPPEKHKEAEAFLESLLAEKDRKPKRPLKLDWRGALRHCAGRIYFR